MTPMYQNCVVKRQQNGPCATMCACAHCTAPWVQYHARTQSGCHLAREALGDILLENTASLDEVAACICRVSNHCVPIDEANAHLEVDVPSTVLLRGMRLRHGRVVLLLLAHLETLCGLRQLLDPRIARQRLTRQVFDEVEEGCRVARLPIGLLQCWAHLRVVDDEPLRRQEMLSDEASCYYHGYVLAEMAVHQTREHFLAT